VFQAGPEILGISGFAVFQRFIGNKAASSNGGTHTTYRVSGRVESLREYRERAGYLILKTNNYNGTKEKKRCY